MESSNSFEIPKELYDIAPNLKIFDKLLQCEKNIDKLLAKKRVDIQEQLARPLCRTKRILRMHIFNNHANQGNPISSVYKFFLYFVTLFDLFEIFQAANLINRTILHTGLFVSKLNY